MPPFLGRLWAGTLTRDEANAGTNSSIALTVIEKGADRLYHLFPDTAQNDQEQGQPNLYEVPQEIVASAKISPERYPHAGFHIRGDDAWAPEVFLVWGERLGDGAVFPFGFNQDRDFEASRFYSTDAAEGPASDQLAQVGPGTEESPIFGFIMLTNTSAEENSGTNNTLTITVSIPYMGPPSRPRVLTAQVPSRIISLPTGDTPQEDLETGLPNLYTVVLQEQGGSQPYGSFTRSALAPNSIRLSIEGDDAWNPSQFFLFGADESLYNGGAEDIVPLVHLPEWNLGPLSTDHNEGRPSIVLPLAPLAPIVPPGSGGGEP